MRAVTTTNTLRGLRELLLHHIQERYWDVGEFAMDEDGRVALSAGLTGELPGSVFAGLAEAVGLAEDCAMHGEALLDLPCRRHGVRVAERAIGLYFERDVEPALASSMCEWLGVSLELAKAMECFREGGFPPAGAGVEWTGGGAPRLRFYMAGPPRCTPWDASIDTLLGRADTASTPLPPHGVRRLLATPRRSYVLNLQHTPESVLLKVELPDVSLDEVLGLTGRCELPEAWSDLPGLTRGSGLRYLGARYLPDGTAAHTVYWGCNLCGA